jgi:uncharacterized membrane protein
MGAELMLATGALGLALLARPWRGVASEGPPWPWLGWLLVMPLCWSIDRLGHMPLLQPLSGACLLVLMAGWPLAMLGLLPVAAATVWLTGWGWDEALGRAVWQGVVPGTLTLLLGAGLRRWLPHHLFVYILGRGFFATGLSCLLGAALPWLWREPVLGTSLADQLLASGLTAWGEAFLTGMLVAIGVAFRPHWLATYSDRLYLPR